MLADTGCYAIEIALNTQRFGVDAEHSITKRKHWHSPITSVHNDINHIWNLKKHSRTHTLTHTHRHSAAHLTRFKVMFSLYVLSSMWQSAKPAITTSSVCCSKLRQFLDNTTSAVRKLSSLTLDLKRRKNNFPSSNLSAGVSASFIRELTVMDPFQLYRVHGTTRTSDHRPLLGPQTDKVQPSSQRQRDDPE
jgi:hypothetical protein